MADFMVNARLSSIPCDEALARKTTGLSFMQSESRSATLLHSRNHPQDNAPT
jgi:hypothetical protein